MKKKLIPILFLCVAALFFLRPSELKLGEAVDHPVNQLPDVDIVIEGVSPTSITAALRNGGDKKLYYGEGFAIEAECNGVWYDVEQRKPMETVAHLKTLAPGADADESCFNWRRWYGSLPNGHYRYVLGVRIDTGLRDERTGAEKLSPVYVIASEFSLD